MGEKAVSRNVSHNTLENDEIKHRTTFPECERENSALDIILGGMMETTVVVLLYGCGVRTACACGYICVRFSPL